MKTKTLKRFFWSSLGIVTASLIGGLSLMALAPVVKTANLVVSLPKNQSLKTNQQVLTSKFSTKGTPPTSADLVIASDGHDGWTVKSLTDQGKKEKTISVPEEVTSIGAGAFQNDAIIESVTLPKTLRGEGVAKNAFNGCTNLKTVTFLPDQLTQIDSAAFMNCTSLENVVLPPTLITLDNDVFHSCSNLKHIDLPKSLRTINPGCFAWTKSLQEICIPEGVTEITYDCFWGCKSLKDVFLPATINHLGPESFQSCGSLTNITFMNADESQGVTMDPIAFRYGWENTNFWVNSAKTKSNLINVCKIAADNIHIITKDAGGSLYLRQVKDQYGVPINEVAGLTEQGKTAKSITVSKNIQKIPNFVFSETKSNSVQISIEGSKISVDPYAFAAMDSAIKLSFIVTNVDVLHALENVGIKPNQISVSANNFTLDGTGSIISVTSTLTNLVVPKTINELTVNGISSAAFEGCTNLQSIEFQDGINLTKDNVNKNAFKGLSNVTLLTYSESIAQVFKDKSSQLPIGVAHGDFFTDYTIPAQLDGLTVQGKAEKVLTIPSGTPKLSKMTFRGATTLEKIIFAGDETILTIADETFQNYPKVTFFVANTTLRDKLLNCKSNISTKRIFLGRKTDYFYINGDNQISGLTPLGQTATELTIPNNASEILNYAFAGDQNLKKMVIENRNLLIDVGAFAGCPGAVFFVNDNSLANKLLSSESGIDSGQVFIGNGDLYINSQNGLGGLTTQGKQAKKLVLQNITIIYPGAFEGCSPSLRTIEIHSNNISIKPGAFQSSPIKDILKKINFYVYNASVRDTLKTNGISSKNIIFVGHISTTTIAVIVIAIVVAFIGLGLGIGLPMRKQHKVNLLNARLTNRRIDNLSSANAMAFKKVIEVTGTLSKKVDQMRVLSSANKPQNVSTRPVRPVRPTRPKPPQSSQGV